MIFAAWMGACPMPMPDDPRVLLGGYATDSLTRSEKEHLCRAALSDQELFDALVAEEELRGVLSDDVFRARLKTRLREHQQREGLTAWERLRRFIVRPQLIPAASLAAILLVVVLVRFGAIEKTNPLAQVALGPAGIPPLQLAGLLGASSSTDESLARQASRLKASSSAGVLLLDRGAGNPQYRVGDE